MKYCLHKTTYNAHNQSYYLDLFTPTGNSLELRYYGVKSRFKYVTKVLEIDRINRVFRSLDEWDSIVRLNIGAITPKYSRPSSPPLPAK